VQVIPHITDEIKARIRRCAEGLDLLIVEIGGTVGDIESLPFLEAIRQMRVEVGHQNSVSVHLTLVPYLPTAGELKTKPTQHSVGKLREIGIQADVLICRSDRALEHGLIKKIAMFCNVSLDAVFQSIDVETIYKLPLLLADQGLDEKLSELLNIWSRAPRLGVWEEIVDKVLHPKRTLTVGLVGKYVKLVESYKSIHEALYHGGIAHDTKVDIRHIDSETIETDGAAALLGDCDALLVAPGFGARGTEGKIQAVQYARENKIPFFGICLGMQMAVVEFARNACNIEGAHSAELNEDTKHPVIDLMPDQRDVTDKGATMRLGAYPCVLTEGSHAHRAYGSTEISERHRHRFEVNNNYRDTLERHGMTLSGLSPDGRLVEMIEVADHPFFVACQFPPEFKSRPVKVHPLFGAFVEAGIAHAAVRNEGADATPAAPPAEQLSS
jgi:CTP synthase